jgi:hypothetical protein
VASRSPQRPVHGDERRPGPVDLKPVVYRLDDLPLAEVSDASDSVVVVAFMLHALLRIPVAASPLQTTSLIVTSRVVHIILVSACSL